MRNAYDIIVQPVITEKSARAIEFENVYTFIVDNGANKIDIGRAVEQIWDVKVEKVRTMRYPGKARRAFLGRMSRNRDIGRRASYKKAMVKLAEGDTIEIYEAG